MLIFRDDIKFWAEIAKRNGVVLVTSYLRREQLVRSEIKSVSIDSDGTLAGKYRKMHIPDDPAFY